MIKVLVSITLLGTTALAADTSAPQVTFAKDVMPILQANCQECHRPGQAAPISLLTYENARPWAKAMKAAVLSRKMPPWFADPQYGHFKNDRSLKQGDIETIVKWADSGAPLGDPKDAPTAIQWPEGGWQVNPDVVGGSGLQRPGQGDRRMDLGAGPQRLHQGYVGDFG